LATVITRNLHRTYSIGGIESVALRGVDLSIEPGEFTVIAGPSGSGKTTLLNLIGAIDSPTKGEILLDGQDLGKLSASQRARVRLERLGFVFQSYNLLPILTARENVELVLELRRVPAGERRRLARQVLEDLGLGELENRRPLEMSGGQQQRVAVARAIVDRPDLVLADEPTANLDRASSEALLNLMQRINEERSTTFVFSTHDPQVMERARRTIVLADGEIVDERATATL